MKRLSPLQTKEMEDLLRPYKKPAINIIVIAMIQAALQAFILLQMKPLLDSSIKSTNLDSIFVSGAIVLILIALHGICAILVSRRSAKICADIAENMRVELFRRIVMTDELDSSSDTSGMMTRLMTDIDNVQRSVTEFLRVWLYTFFLTVALIVVSFLMDVKVGIPLLIAVLVVYVIIIYAAKKEFDYRRAIVDNLEKVLRYFRDCVKGARNRRYLGNLERDEEEFKAIGKDYSALCDNTRIRAYKRTSLARVIFIVVLCSLILLAFRISNTRNIDLTTIILIIQMAMLLETSLSLFPFFIESIPVATASLGKINDALNYNMDTNGTVPKTSDSRYIIRSASERYPSIIRGQETSIITMADAGSWDFVQIMTGTKNTARGELFLEEQDITDIAQEYITKKIAYAGPRALTFDGTLFDNIDLWRGMSEERIKEICSILSIDKTLDFKIERNSVNISTSEALKISVARALASDADIYIFENCFVLVDHDAKRQAVKYIRSSLKGKTVIFISPHTSVSKGSDNIIIVSEGKVICNDTKAAVTASNELYGELCMTRRCSSERD